MQSSTCWPGGVFLGSFTKVCSAPSTIVPSEPTCKPRSGRRKMPPRTKYGAATDLLSSRIRSCRAGSKPSILVPDTPARRKRSAGASSERSRGKAFSERGSGPVYLDRHWPPAFKDSEAWPLASLRQGFLNGTLTRLIDPDPLLRTRIAEYVTKGEFGLASGAEPGGKYRRVWFREDVGPTEIAFEADVYLLTKLLAEKLKSPEVAPVPPPGPERPSPETPSTRRVLTRTVAAPAAT